MKRVPSSLACLLPAACVALTVLPPSIARAQESSLSSSPVEEVEDSKEKRGLRLLKKKVEQKKETQSTEQKEERQKPKSPYQVTKTSTEVRKAIRQLLSSDEHQRRQGRHKLELFGKNVIPELRYWIRAMRDRLARVERFVAEIEGDHGRTLRLIGSADRFLDSKFREAKRLAREGEFRPAAELGRAILLLGENRPQAWLVRRFVRDCQERLATTELLDPSFFVPRQVYEVGEVPELTFRLANRQKREVVVYLEKGVLGEATVVVRRHFSDGQWKNSEVRISVRAESPDGRIVIGPGNSWERRLKFKLDEALPISGAVARVEFSGRFRPTRWTANDPNENLALPLARASFWIVPPSQAPLSDRPLQKMTAALLFSKEEAFFVGGQLAVWAGEGDSVYNGKLVETLIRRLDTFDGQRLQQACWFLSQSTGEDIEADAASWNEWWRTFHREPEAIDEDGATATATARG